MKKHLLFFWIFLFPLLSTAQSNWLYAAGSGGNDETLMEDCGNDAVNVFTPNGDGTNDFFSFEGLRCRWKKC
jgi:hypothetical protein